MIKVNINLTWSKVMALLILIAAVGLDWKNDTGASAFMYAIPFISALILGKQGVKLIEEIKTNKKIN
jgi:hypothetical protein